MTRVFIFFFLITNISFSQTLEEKETNYRDSINTEFEKNYKKCYALNLKAVTNFNGKKEFWRICSLKDKYRIIQIESHKDSIYYQEIYFEKNGDLIYAKETENYIPDNNFNQMSWNCQFYTEKGELITMISLGHGKTEDDEWNPESIFGMYKSRLTELAKIKK